MIYRMNRYLSYAECWFVRFDSTTSYGERLARVISVVTISNLIHWDHATHPEHRPGCLLLHNLSYLTSTFPTCCWFCRLHTFLSPSVLVHSLLPLSTSHFACVGFQCRIIFLLTTLISEYFFSFYRSSGKI